MLLLLLCTKVICTSQVCQSGHCAAHYAYFIYLEQFRHLKDHMPDRHQVWAFCISYVGLRFCVCFDHLHYREFVCYQWCGGLHFVGAAILTDGCQPQNPRRERHNLFWVDLLHGAPHFNKLGRCLVTQFAHKL